MHPPPPRELWRRILRRRRGSMLAIIGLSLASGAAILFCRQPLYQATASVVARPPRGMAELGARAALLPNTALLATTAEELSSRSAVQAAMERLGPRSAHLLAPPLRDPAWLQHRWPPPPTPQARLRAVRRRLQIIPVPYSRVLQLRFTAPQPALAAAFLHALLTGYLDRNASRQRAEGLRQVRYLQLQTADARAGVQAAVTTVAAVAARQGLSDPAAAMQAAGARWQQLAAAATSAQVAALQQADALARRAPPPAAATGSDLAVPGDVYVQQAQLAASVERLAQQYRPQALPLRQARAQLQAVNADILRLHAQQRQRQSAALAAVRQQEHDLRAALARQKHSQVHLRAALARYDLAQQQLDARRSGYSRLLSQLQQAVTAAGFVTPPLRIGDPVSAGTRPLSPRPVPLLAGTLLLGCALALAWAWLAERADDHLLFPEASELGVPVAATLPLLPPGQSAWAPRVRGVQSYPAFAQAVECCAASLAAARAISGASVVFLTSTAAGDGKTSLALALAERLAHLAPVLLLDAHPARPAVAHAYGGSTAPGLAELLCGKASLDSVWHASQSGIAPSGAALSYISAGSAAGAGLSLPLADGAAAALLASARTRFEWVILDGPPVGAGPEAAQWAALADCTLTLAQHAQSSRRALRHCLDTLEAAGAQALALVVNQAPGNECHPEWPLWRPGLAPETTAATPMRLQA